MTTEIPTLSEVIMESIASRLGSVHTSFPVVVIGQDLVKHTVTVEPVVRGRRMLPDGSLETYKMPAIPGVPVLFFSTATHSITAPISNGDTGMVFCAERSTDEWKATGSKNSDPRDPRRFDLADAFFLPAGRSLSDPIPASGFDSTDMVISGPIRLGSASALDPVALSGKVMLDFNALKNIFTIWTPAPGDGGAVLKGLLTAAIGGGWPSDVAATKVKAE